MRKPTLFQPLDAVELDCPPAKYKHLLGQVAHVREVTEIPGSHLARIQFHGSDTCIEINTLFLKKAAFPAVEVKNPRRGPLTLREPKDKRTEAERQKQGVEFLRDLGYWVDEICRTRVGQHCQKCGAYVPPAAGYNGTDPGVSDTKVSHPHWPGNPIPELAIEWKKRVFIPGITKPGDEREATQLKRIEQNRSRAAWNLQTLCDALSQFEDSIGLTSDPEILRHCTKKEESQIAA